MRGRLASSLLRGCVGAAGSPGTVSFPGTIYLSMVDLPRPVYFWYIAKWFCYTHIYTHLFFRLFSVTVYHRVLNRVPRAVQSAGQFSRSVVSDSL